MSGADLQDRFNADGDDTPVMCVPVIEDVGERATRGDVVRFGFATKRRKDGK